MTLHLTLGNKLKKGHYYLIDHINRETTEKQFTESIIRGIQDIKLMKMGYMQKNENHDKPGKLQNVVMNL